MTLGEAVIEKPKQLGLLFFATIKLTHYQRDDRIIVIEK